MSDLGPLAGLSALQSLDCSSTQVSDLGPLAGLSALQSLDCSGTQVSDLGPLAGLSALQSLNCSGTQVSDLGPLAGLSALQSLDCSETQVSDLGPLAGLSCAAIAPLLRDPGERSAGAFSLARITQKAHSFQHPHHRHSRGGLIPGRLTRTAWKASGHTCVIWRSERNVCRT